MFPIFISVSNTYRFLFFFNFDFGFEYGFGFTWFVLVLKPGIEYRVQALAHDSDVKTVTFQLDFNTIQFSELEHTVPG